MTAEDFHDALTLLPGDLVAEADKHRRKPRLVMWHRWAAMAACLVLVLSCGLLVGSWNPGKTQAYDALSAPALSAEAAPAEAAPAVSKGEADWNPERGGMDAAAADEQSRYAVDAGAVAPGVTDITWAETPWKDASAGSSSGEPKAVLIQSRELLEDYLAGCENQNVEALREGTEGYDETWFSTHDLLMLRLVCSEDAAVTGIREEKGHWEIDLEEPAPESPARAYHILITVEKGIIGSADDVTALYHKGG